MHSASPNFVTLKIKSEDGNHTFQVKMCFSETIGHLRRYLDKHRWDHISLRCNSFPNTTLLCFFFVCVIEEAVSPIMTSSACIRGAATAMTVRCSAAVDSRGTPRCCCRRENVDVLFKSGTSFIRRRIKPVGTIQVWNKKWWKSLFLKYASTNKDKNMKI